MTFDSGIILILVYEKEMKLAMENGLHLIYEGVGIFLFCLAVSFVFQIFSELGRAEKLTTDNLYDEHVFYSVVVK